MTIETASFASGSLPLTTQSSHGQKITDTLGQFAGLLEKQMENTVNTGQNQADNSHASDDVAIIKEKGFAGYFKELQLRRIEKLRDEILMAMGITQEDLGKMSPKDRAAIEKTISEEIQKRLAAESAMQDDSAGNATLTGSESIWQKTASKYDVRNITTDETAELSQKLYDAGEISLLDHAILSFDPSHLHYGTTFLTQADSTGHRDLISEYETRINMNKKMGDRQSLMNNEQILEYLNRLDR
ncbi:hypothetical protein [Desulfobacula phenolica]|uniref:Uncharacterized protein n=1 Tax=Desulfobacula phenolica TaxID=90732 RepID=A0A1H2FJM9_9BACT|nr:hypothetical protein [Desulfobacula phenolica]SDU07512.1 hypothetical protein SAMN04487931_104195 [Desulfobacula phenolica]